MPSIADVYLTVLPEVSKVADGIRRGLREADKDAAEAGRRYGSEIQRGIGDVKVKIDADTSKAEAQIDAMARDRKATVEVDADTLGSSVQRGISQGGQAGIGALQPALMGIGITMAAGIASALSGLTALIPAGGLGGLAVIGTLATGLDGVKNAWDAAGKAAQSSGADQASKAREVASAQITLKDAVMSEEQAQKDVAIARKDARQQLQDLNLELRGGVLNEKQAVLDAMAARRDLQQGRFKDSIAYQQAQLRVQEADQRVAEAHQRNTELQTKTNDANAKGVDNADNVVAANNRLTRSHEQVTQAQSNLDFVNNKVSDSAKTATQAMSLLAPNAQQFVSTLMALKPVWMDLKNTVQDNLFAGVGQQFQTLATQYAPTLKSVMGSLATTMNQAFGQFAQFLGQPQTMAAMQQIFANIGSSFQIWSQALQPFSEAFLKVTQVGSTFLPQLAQMVVQVAQAFNQWAQSGQLGTWIQTGITALQQLGGVIQQLLPMFMQLAPIGTAALGAIQSILAALAPYIPSLATSFANLINALTPLITDIINLLLPALTQTLSALGKHPQLIRDVVVAFLAWNTISGVSALLGNLGKVSTFMRTTLPADAAAGAAGMSSALGPIAALLAGIYAATGGHPEDYLTPGGSKSVKTDADQGHWAKVLFGDTVGGWLEQNVFNTSPSASAAPFGPNDVYGPMSRNALDRLHGTDIPTPAATAASPPGGTPGYYNKQPTYGQPGYTPPGMASLAPSAPTSGGFPWDAVAQAEASGNWQNADTGKSGHFGGLQFSPATWAAFGGLEFASRPDLATREQQIEVANRTAFTGYSGTKPQGLGAWETITKGMVPGVTVNTPQTGMPTVSATAATPAVPGGNVYTGPHTDDTHGAIVPNNARLQQLIEQQFPQIKDIGGYRPPDQFKEHSSGEASDVMIPGWDTPQGKALGEQINQWLIQNAGQLGLQYTLWEQKQWNPNGTSQGMPDRGSPNENHFTHIHARVTPGVAASGDVFSQPGAAGTQEQPIYVDYGPNSNFQQSSGGPGQQLGQDLLSGILQVFGFDGSVFKDPTSFGAFKFLKGGMGVLSGFLGAGDQQGQGGAPGGGALPNLMNILPGMNQRQPGQPSARSYMPPGPFGPPTGPPPGPTIMGDYQPITVSPNVDPNAILGPVQAQQNSYNSTTFSNSGGFPAP